LEESIIINLLMAANHRNRTILVTGATGHQGGAVLRHLREKHYPVRALTRDANSPKSRALMTPGVEPVSADLDDPASLGRALEDVYGVYSVQPFTDDIEGEVRQGSNLVDAANRAEVSHFVYSSVVAADAGTGIPHFESKGRIEEHLRNTGTPYTIFRPVSFMENWLGAKEQLEAGTLSLPLKPETRLQMIAVDDIGAFVTQAFEHSGHWNGKTYELAGDELPMQEIAQALGRAIGREVKYVQVPWDEFEKMAGHELTIMYRWFDEVGYQVNIDSVREQYPRLLTFGEWLARNWPKTNT
jgi:uncharacterized protein YbjT (DUF2867 family)